MSPARVTGNRSLSWWLFVQSVLFLEGAVCWLLCGSGGAWPSAERRPGPGTVLFCRWPVAFVSPHFCSYSRTARMRDGMHSWSILCLEV